MITSTKPSENIQEIKKKSGVKLELLSGPMDGLEFEIMKDVITIGRELDRDISIPLDNLVSRLHARINFCNGEYWLEDLGSRNGTFIGEKRLMKKFRLLIGTIFKIGNTEMRLRKLYNN